MTRTNEDAMPTDADTRMIGVPVAAMPAVHAELARGRTAAEAADVARRVGFSLGPALVASFEERLDSEGGAPAGDLAPDEFWSRLGEFLASSGWGELEVDDAGPGVVSLSSATWAEAEGRSTTHPSCHLSTGMLAAVVSLVAGTDLAILEAGCRAAGADRCTFLVGGRDALTAVHSRMRDGSAPAEAVAALR